MQFEELIVNKARTAHGKKAVRTNAASSAVASAMEESGVEEGKEWLMEAG